MSTDSVYFRKSIRAFKKHRCFVWIHSQLQIHTMLYVGGALVFEVSSTPGGYVNPIHGFHISRGVLDFGLDEGVPPGPRDPNPCLEVKKGTHV